MLVGAMLLDAGRCNGCRGLAWYDSRRVKDTRPRLSIAIVGAGMGGLTAASTLRLFGYDVQVGDIRGAFARYETHRKPRTSSTQAISSANTWMRGGSDDTSWLYGYDAWNVPLSEPALNPAS